MRYAVRNCSDPRDHRIHYDTEGPSRDFEEESTTYVCPGGRRGDALIRQYDSLFRLVAELERASQPLGTFTTPCPEVEAYGYTYVKHVAPWTQWRRGIPILRCNACGIHLVD